MKSQDKSLQLIFEKNYYTIDKDTTCKTDGIKKNSQQDNIKVVW